MKAKDTNARRVVIQRLLIAATAFLGITIAGLSLSAAAQAVDCTVGSSSSVFCSTPKDNTGDGNDVNVGDDGGGGGGGGGPAYTRACTDGEATCLRYYTIAIDNRKSSPPAGYDLPMIVLINSKARCPVTETQIGGIAKVAYYELLGSQSLPYKMGGPFVSAEITGCIPLDVQTQTVNCYAYFGDKQYTKTNRRGVATTTKMPNQNLTWNSNKTVESCKKSWEQEAKFGFVPDEYAKYKLTMGVYGHTVDFKIYGKDFFTNKVRAPEIKNLAKVKKTPVKLLTRGTAYSYLACNTMPDLKKLTKDQYNQFNLKRLLEDSECNPTKPPVCTVPDKVTVNGETVKAPANKPFTLFRDADENSVVFEEPKVKVKGLVTKTPISTRLLRSGTPWASDLTAKSNYVTLAPANSSDKVSKVTSEGLTFKSKIVTDYEAAARMASDAKKPTVLQNVTEMAVTRNMTVTEVISWNPKTDKFKTKTRTREVTSDFICESPEVKLNFVRGVNAY